MNPPSSTSPGWVIEVLSSGLERRRRRYLVAIEDRARAIGAVFDHLGPETDITSVVPVLQDVLDISGVERGKLVPL